MRVFGEGRRGAAQRSPGTPGDAGSATNGRENGGRDAAVPSSRPPDGQRCAGASRLPGITSFAGAHDVSNGSLRSGSKVRSTIILPPHFGQIEGSGGGSVSRCSSPSGFASAAASPMSVRASGIRALMLPGASAPDQRRTLARPARRGQPVVPDARVAAREHMHQEASDELLRVERLLPHAEVRPALRAVTGQETDAAVGDGEDAAVGNADAMRVAGEVLADCERSAKWLLRVYDPLLEVEA